MHFLKSLCGESFYVSNEKGPGNCFLQLCIVCPTYALLAIMSAYYVGKIQSQAFNFRFDRILLSFRILISILLLLLPIVQLLYVKFMVQSNLSALQYLVMLVVSFAWLVHIIYLTVLMKGVPSHKGPLIIFLCFVLCFLISAFLLFLDFHKNLEAFFKVFSTINLLLQALYFVTLIPKGNSREWRYEELSNINVITSEQEPLLRNASGYYGFQEELDPLSLHVAEEPKHIFSRLLFLWVKRLMKKGYNNKLQNIEDLYDLPPSLQASSIHDRVSSKLCIHSSGTEYTSLVKGLHHFFGCEYYSIGLLKFLSDCLSFGGPMLLNALVSYLESNKKKGFKEGYFYALGLFCVTFFGALCSTHYSYLVSRTSLKIRASLIMTVYKKVLLVSQGTISTFNTGEILNFISTDTDRIVNFCQSFHQFWSLPVQVVIALYLLYVQVGYCFLLGLSFAIIIIPLNQYIAKKIGVYSFQMMKEKDKRVKVLNEILNGIRVIKMYTWEAMFSKKIDAIREREIEFLKKRKYLDALCVYFWVITPIVISFLTFTAYVLMGNTLTASKVFTSIALFNILIMPLNAFPWVLNGLVEAWISVKRLNVFLHTPNLDLNEYYTEPSSPDLKLEIVNGLFKHPRANSEENLESSSSREEFYLGPLNLKVKQGDLVCIVGKVGTGKSSLLSSLLANLECHSGQMKLTQSEIIGGIGYVPQEPWIQQASIKENILFGKSMNSLHYRNVLEACALFEDLKALPCGDQTEVGERGVTLSGGQKTRIALARAVYQDFELYLLDDPFSSLDVQVSQYVFSSCILRTLQSKTRILCTNQTQFLTKADYVVILSEGKIFSQGPPQQALPLYCVSESKAEGEEGKSTQTSLDNISSNEGTLIQKEGKDEGFVKFHVYEAYWKAIGTPLVLAVLISCSLMQASRTLSDWWLSFWMSNVENHLQNTTSLLISKTTFYLSVYGSLSAASSVFAAFRAFLFAFAGIKAAVMLHKKLLQSIIKAKTAFFDSTPVGRILNRLSSDIYCVDDTLPFVLNILIAQLFALLGSLLITCFGLPWIILLLAPLAVLYFRIQRYYRCTSRELKRLSSISLSPIYAHFSETLNGHATIRALASTCRFQQDHMKKLDRNQQAMLSTLAASQWLQLRLQFIGVTIVTGVAFLAVIESSHVDAGLIGLVLSYALSITLLLNGMVTSLTETEKEVVSVERILQYVEGISPECDGPAAILDVPTYGVLSFRDVSLRYADGTALQNVSFETRHAEKLGIVGRTGSGKSSLIQALFRMSPICSGTICIDGVDTCTLPLQVLRSCLSVIPQHPFLFSGNLRDNLDPDFLRSDAEIWKALLNCHMKEKIQALGGLGMQVEEGGCNFSTGEKQLICLARTLLHRTKIVCLDEAMASVDPETASLIQASVRLAFRHATVLHVAHRVESVMDCDRVLVMSHGRLLEIDTPATLLGNPHSYFYRLVYK